MFNINLKELRKKNRLSQDELGKILNLSQSSIGHYEKGTRIPDIETVIKISNYFNVSIDWLLTGNKPYQNITKEENKLLDVYNQLNDRYKGKVETYAEMQLEEQNKQTNEHVKGATKSSNLLNIS